MFLLFRTLTRKSGFQIIRGIVVRNEFTSLTRVIRYSMLWGAWQCCANKNKDCYFFNFIYLFIYNYCILLTQYFIFVLCTLKQNKSSSVFTITDAGGDCYRLIHQC